MSKFIKLLCAIGVIAIFGFNISFAAEALNGESLYQKACASCHKNPTKKAGKPAAEVFQKLKGFQTNACPTGKLMDKQNILKKCSDEQLNAISNYLEKLK